MKIVIDARQLRTGSGRYVERLIHNLQIVDKINSYIILLQPKDMDGWTPTNSKFQKMVCPYKQFSFGEQIGLWAQVRTLKPDLVHFPFAQQPILYSGKVVTTMHDLTALRFRNPSANRFVFIGKQFIYKILNRYVARKSLAVITPTQFVKKDVAIYTHISLKKIVVTPEGADKITDAPIPNTQVAVKKFIMYVGRPLPNKNLDRLLHAFEILKKSNPDIALVLVGKKGAIYQQYETKVAKNSIHDVLFTDFVSEGQLRWLYEHAELYVFPSLSEGFGLPGLEAMAHGCPVVSSNATCLPEAYGDAAHYFDPLSVEDMSAKISEVLNDPALRSQLITRGSKQIQKYSWKRMAQQTLEVYSQVLSK